MPKKARTESWRKKCRQEHLEMKIYKDTKGEMQGVRYLYYRCGNYRYSCGAGK